MKKDTYTIDVDRWRSGGNGSNRLGSGHTQLENNLGFCCCIGFICKQSGVSRDKILAKPVPKGEDIEIQFLYERNAERASNLLTQAITINDMESISLEERVKRLRLLFKDYGIRLVFKNLKKHVRQGKYKHK